VHTAPCTQTRLRSLLLGLEAPLASGTEAGEGLRRLELTGGEPSGGAVSTNTLRTPSRIDRCSCSAGWLTRASMLACMAHDNTATRRPHRSRAWQGGRGGTGAPRLRGEASACEREKRKAAKLLVRAEQSSGGRREANHSGLLPCRRWVAKGALRRGKARALTCRGLVRAERRKRARQQRLWRGGTALWLLRAGEAKGGVRQVEMRRGGSGLGCRFWQAGGEVGAIGSTRREAVPYTGVHAAASSYCGRA
jgi:hypothetical protein